MLACEYVIEQQQKRGESTIEELFGVGTHTHSRRYFDGAKKKN